MNVTYSFLRDEVALQEIRKHKWIESEKAGEEIGFATAAYDWINKYGYTWKQFRLDSTFNKDILAERRDYRRFRCHFPLLLSLNQQKLVSYTNDVSLIGLSCTLPIHIKEETALNVTMGFPSSVTNNQLDQFQFETIVLRSSPLARKKSNLCHTVFLNFNEKTRDHLRQNPHLLADSLV